MREHGTETEQPNCVKEHGTETEQPNCVKEHGRELCASALYPSKEWATTNLLTSKFRQFVSL